MKYNRNARRRFVIGKLLNSLKIVLTFLKNLGLDARTAEADAEGIEHHVSDKTLKKMEQFNKKN